MVNVTCNGMRILVVFVDVYEKCDHLFFGLVFVYEHFICRGHCVSQWTKFLLGLNFSVCMCYLVKQNQKQSKKCGPSVCVASQKQNRNMQVFTLLLFTIL